MPTLSAPIVPYLSAVPASFLCHYFIKTTSVLLHTAVFFLPRHGLKGTPLHLLLALFLLLAFVAWRILPLPPLAFSVYASRAALATLPLATRVAIGVAFPVPPAIFLYWFSVLFRGAVKTLGGGGESAPGSLKRASS